MKRIWLLITNVWIIIYSCDCTQGNIQTQSFNKGYNSISEHLIQRMFQTSIKLPREWDHGTYIDLLKAFDTVDHDYVATYA